MRLFPPPRTPLLYIYSEFLIRSLTKGLYPGTRGSQMWAKKVFTIEHGAPRCGAPIARWPPAAAGIAGVL